MHRADSRDLLEAKDVTVGERLQDRTLESVVADTSDAVNAAELEAILCCIADGILVYDTEGHIVRSNAAADEILGIQPQDRERKLIERVRERYGVWSEDGRLLRPEEMPAFRAAIHAETVRGEVLRIEGTGEPRWISARCGRRGLV